MAWIAWPAELELRTVTWRQDWPRLVQRSEFSGRTRIAAFGSAPRWTADCTLPPLDAAGVRRARAFFAELAVPGNTTALAAVEHPQALTNWGSTFTAVPALAATQQAFVGTALKTYALRGDLAVITYPATGTRQMVTLTADAITDGAGAAILRWAEPLRQGGASVTFDTYLPSPLMRAGPDILSWGVEPHGIYGAPGFMLEEAF